MLALLLACAPAGTDSTPEEGTDDTATDGGTVDLGPCPAYSGYTVQGRTWAMSLLDDLDTGIGYESTLTLTTLDASGAWQVDYTDVTGPGTADEWSYSGTITGACDAEGLWIADDTYVIADGSGGEVTNHYAYDPPYLALKADLAVGDTWETQMTGTLTNNHGENPIDFTVTYEATRATSVTVPAGTFDTVELTMDVGWGPTYSWVDAAVGTVATDTLELDAVSP